MIVLDCEKVRDALGVSLFCVSVENGAFRLRSCNQVPESETLNGHGLQQERTVYVSQLPSTEEVIELLK